MTEEQLLKISVNKLLRFQIQENLPPRDKKEQSLSQYKEILITIMFSLLVPNEEIHSLHFFHHT